MENQRYMQEGIDLKRIFLLMRKKIWVMAAAIIAGVLLGSGIYLLVHFVFASEPEYQAVSKIYLNFNCDPEDYNELSYNGYTWNDLMITDPILDHTMEGLPSGIDRETVINATKAEILSDIRLLTITITAKQPELTEQIMEATQASLVHLGNTDQLFESIQIYSTTTPERVVLDNRVVSAAVTGAVLAFLAVLLVMAFGYVLDDSVYVQGDVEKRYGIPVIGIFTAGGSGTSQSYAKEFFDNYTYICDELEEIALASIDCEEDARNAVQTIDRILSAENKSDEFDNVPVGMPEDTRDKKDIYEKIRWTKGVIIAIRFGSRNGKRLERAISNMKKQDCKILGAVIVEADEKFLNLYYMGKNGA